MVHQTPVETIKIDKEIVAASGKEHPKMLFIGTASRDSVSYFETVRNHFVDRLGCASVNTLNLLENTYTYDELCQKIFSVDIVYVGGGDTTMMLKVWKEYKVDKILYEAYQKGIVLAGISAGAICWFEYYDNMDDISDISELDIVPGLGFLKGFAVPHYNWLTSHEKAELNRILTERKITGFATDDCTALVFKDDEMDIISCRMDRTVIKIP